MLVGLIISSLFSLDTYNFPAIFFLGLDSSLFVVLLIFLIFFSIDTTLKSLFEDSSNPFCSPPTYKIGEARLICRYDNAFILFILLSQMYLVSPSLFTCRPIDVPDKSGCVVTMDECSTSISLGSSISVPISVIDSEKVSYCFYTIYCIGLFEFYTIYCIGFFETNSCSSIIKLLSNHIFL